MVTPRRDPREPVEVIDAADLIEDEFLEEEVAHAAAALDLRLGLGEPDRRRSAPVAAGPVDDQDGYDDEPEIPEYLLAERRQQGRSRGGSNQRPGNRGAPGGRNAPERRLSIRGGSRAIRSQRVPRSTNSFGGSTGGNNRRRGDRQPDRNRGGQGGQGGRGQAPVRQPRPVSAEPRERFERTERPAASAEPWSEVPADVQDMLRAELARRQPAGRPQPVSQSSEPGTTAPAAAGRDERRVPRPPTRPRRRGADPGAEARPRHPPRHPSSGPGPRPRGRGTAEPIAAPAAEAKAPAKAPARSRTKAAAAESRPWRPRSGSRGPCQGSGQGTRPLQGQGRCRRGSAEAVQAATRPRHPRRRVAGRPSRPRPRRVRAEALSRSAASGGLLTRGHPLALSAVRRAIGRGRAPHAILLVGPRAVGKTTLAMDLAAGLLCSAQDPRGDPAVPARRVARWSTATTPTCTASQPEGAGEQIRIGQVQALVTDLALMPMEGRVRVAIIEAAHRLNPDAQNALLKTLEEPVGAACIVLCADDPATILPTVTSRCARFRLGPVPLADIGACWWIGASPTRPERPASRPRPGACRVWRWRSRDRRRRSSSATAWRGSSRTCWPRTAGPASASAASLMADGAALDAALSGETLPDDRRRTRHPPPPAPPPCRPRPLPASSARGRNPPSVDARRGACWPPGAMSAATSAVVGGRCPAGYPAARPAGGAGRGRPRVEAGSWSVPGPARRSGCRDRRLCQPGAGAR